MGDLASDSPNSQVPPGAAAVLTHPSGSKVYLVGVAHVSAKAAEDAEECIMVVQPAVVLLELDEKRFQRLMKNLDQNDPCGVLHAVHGGVLQPMKTIFGGHLVEFGMNVAYAVSGAMLGVPPGEEFRAAVRAAERVGAEIVLADRDQETTLKRLSRAALLYNQRPDYALSESEGRGPAGAPASPGRPAAPLGPASSGDVMSRITDRWQEMLKEAGCGDPEAVLKAFQRVMVTGSSKKGAVAPEDVLTVRECGQKVVETYREKAMKEGSTVLDDMEVEALKEVGESTGLLGVGAAVTEVILRERDLVLARRLWEAGEKAAGRPIVGIVGAGHVQGICRKWQWAGSPEAARSVQELCTAPRDPATTGSLITTGVVGAGFGYLAYKRPKLAIAAAGLVGFTTLPYVAAMVYTVNRWTRLLDNVVQAAQQVPPAFSGAAADAWGNAAPDGFQ